MPERIRVHALAKLLGTTSKRILAKLTELGSEARSAQSNVDRDVAHSVRQALAEQETEGSPGGAAEVAAPSAAVEPAVDAPTATEGGSGSPGGEKPSRRRRATRASTAASAAGEPAPGTGAEGSGAGAAAEQSRSGATAEQSRSGATAGESVAGAAGASRSGGTAGESGSGASAGESGSDTAPRASASAHGSLFTHRETPEAAVAAPAYDPAAVAVPLFQAPDAAAAEEERRRRRAEREAAKRSREEERAREEAAQQAGVERAEDDRGADQPRTEQAQDDGDDSDDDRESGEHDDDQPRRRRRGRRGRGRGRGEQNSDGDDDERTDSEDDDQRADEPEGRTDDAKHSTDDAKGSTDDAKADDDSDDDEDDSGVPEGASRRRRRRRRRKVGGDSGEADASEDDPPNTVVHEREPRAKSRKPVDEVQGISGSTRLEAKRQRRRDGREAGRRRPPILTESEFLARREAVDRVMVVREKSFPDHPTATQVAVLEDDILVEHFVTSTGQASMVGNVYLGKVQNVLPSMEAAFVDIGRGRNGVLYAGEVNWEAAGLGGRERKIEQALRPGDQVLVQVSKDPVGHKGARLTTQISLAGRFLVYVPSGTSAGISRKLPDTERKRLKEILRDIVPDDAGVIIRTASEGVSAAELARDVERLQATWRTIEEQAKGGSGAPKTLYEEPDLLVKVVRDLFNEDFSNLVIEGDRAWSTVENYVRTVAPDMLSRVHRHENGNVDAFQTYRIDEQLAKALDRKVWLPSGGTLVIDRTEAMTVVDVNTGKFTGSGGSNLEETVTRNNLEAAEEIVRQMRLRDIGGMIVVDFIDMVLESNRDLVLRRLTEALGRDRTRHQVSEVTSLGLVQMTRKKLGTGLVEAFSTTCEHCHGRGILVHSYPVEAGGAPEESGGGRGGRNENGSRRRRGRDKGAAAQAPSGNGAAEPEHDEDTAARRAHPVALAMAAAHQGDEVLASDIADGAEDAAVTPSGPDVAVVVGAGTTGPEAGDDAEHVPTGRGRRRSRRASRGAGRAGADERVAVEQVAGERAAAEADPATSSAIEPGDAPSAAEVAEAAEEVAAGQEAAEAAAERDAATAAGGQADARGAQQSAAAQPAVAATDSGSRDTVVPAAAADRGHPDTGAATTAPEPAAAAGEAADAARSAIEPGDAPSPEATAAAAAEVNGAAAQAPRRRRVARSAAAPSADSTGAVFVLSGPATTSAEPAPAGPATASAEPAPADPVGAEQVPVVRSRPRRRAVGRPAGPPVDGE
ncbi:translation initiation factor IF-2 N-terminal domain-containing protein [Nocardia harenae]|uniref:translation initiation factor IF-2 N-terminal domain-containing protein n=1 Tax=Nocardia harenae TaxID=358707 RepID=UPI0009FCF986|nr:translation initiation factor IF-2 N-terminal domain-containing protein [Nocardia harenae]